MEMQRFRDGVNRAAMTFLREREEEWEIPVLDERLPGESLEHMGVSVE